MQIQADITGFDRLQRRVARLAEPARQSKIVRRGISEASALVAKAQRNMAPVRKARVRLRQLDRNMRLRRTRNPETKQVRFGRWSVAKATARASVAQRKFRAIRKVGGVRPEGPRELIKPGQLKRSIHSRVRVLAGGLFAKAGMNVGLKRNDRRRAPHGHFVALGTALRRTKRRLSTKGKGKKTWNAASRGVMPANSFIRDASAMVAAQARRLLERRVREDFLVTVTEATRK